MPGVDQEDIEKAIKAIHNIAVMLTGATEYVCEGRILKRFSKEIEGNLERLEIGIASLKKSFPGKFPEDLKPDSSLSRIRDVAKMLKRDNADMVGQCRSGNLGNTLNLTILELRGIVKDILDTLSGRVSRYTFIDRIADYRGSVRSFLSGLSPFISHGGKVILAPILIAIFCLVYLFLTMDSEDVLLGSIKDDLAFIERQKGALDTHRQEYEQIRQEIKSLRGKELMRERKIEYLNLAKEERRIKELIDRAMASIEKRGREVEEKNKKAEEIRNKSFFQKLFRR